MSSIKLSILIPAYNYKLGIKKIIDCLKNTDEHLIKNIEVIISDDSRKKLIDDGLNKELSNKFSNYKYTYNKKNLGAVNNWNKLIYLAKGDYFWLLHHDESWEKDVDMIDFILKTIINKRPNILILPIVREKKLFFSNNILNISTKHKTNFQVLVRFLRNPMFLLKLNILNYEK